MISRSAVDYRDERAAKELENELLKAKGKGFPLFYLLSTHLPEVLAAATKTQTRRWESSSLSLISSMPNLTALHLLSTTRGMEKAREHAAPVRCGERWTRSLAVKKIGSIIVD